MASSGWDRCRFRERLQAALAGLQELHMLREQQEKMSHLRNRLDQQISTLTLDVDKSSTGNLESDSRPSSGFYELSDISSCSLSNSCTSVYSECLSSMYKGVKPCSQKCKNYLKIEYRPRSADEKTMCVSREVCTRDDHEIRTNSGLSNIHGKKNQRPVSTGDLERVITVYHGFQSNSDCQRLSTFKVKDDILFKNVNPKYHNDLVSKSRNEIYTYPSPLHAVALQSPLFSLSTESENKCSIEDNKTVFGFAPAPYLSAEMKPKGYINKLLQVSNCQEIRQLEFSQETDKKTQPALPQQTLISQHCPIGISNNSIFQRQKQASIIEGDIKEKEQMKKIEMQLNEDAKQTHITNEKPKIIVQVPSGKKTFLSTNHPSTMHQHELIGLNHSSNKTSQDSMQKISHASFKVDSPQKEVCTIKNVEQCEFVQAKFIPAESDQVKIRVSTSKNILINGKRRNSEQVMATSPVYIVEQPMLRESVRLKDECTEHCKLKVGRKRSIKNPTFLVTATRKSYLKDNLNPDQCRNPSFASRSPADASLKALYSSSFMEVQPHINMKHKCRSSVDISVKKHHSNFSRRPQTVWIPNKKLVKRAGITHLRHIDINYESESEYSAECASLFHSTVLETSDEVASEYTTNRYGDIGSSDTTSDSCLSLDFESLNVIDLRYANNTYKTMVAPSLNRHSQPEPKVCRIKASKALKKKIRRFHPGSLKIITMM